MRATRGVKIFTADMAVEQEIREIEALVSAELANNPQVSVTWLMARHGRGEDDGDRSTFVGGSTLTAVVEWRIK